jgi:hypothetical protein
VVVVQQLVVQLQIGILSPDQQSTS